MQKLYLNHVIISARATNFAEHGIQLIITYKATNIVKGGPVISHLEWVSYYTLL